MEWDEFLKQPDVSQAKLHISPERYLLGWILHDVLVCLNKFLAIVEIVFQTKEMSLVAQTWLSKWQHPVTEWVLEVTALSKKLSKEPKEDLDGFKFVSIVENVLHKAHQMAQEAQLTHWAEQENALELLEALLSNLDKLNLIYQHIQQQNYMELWKMSGAPTKD